MSTHAIRASKNIRRWGIYAAARYAAKRGVPPRLLILAMRLEKIKMKPLYAVLYGVDTRHLHESAGVFGTLRDARAAYDSVPQTFKAKRISRLEFARPYEPATKVVVVKEVIA